MEQITGILALALVAWFWLDSMRARETAIGASRRACQEYGVQLLDETVALARLRLRRDPLGRLQLYRVYRFEFTETGDYRHSGTVALLGGRLAELHLDYPPRLV